jgi:hypothetical protein
MLYLWSGMPSRTLLRTSSLSTNYILIEKQLFSWKIAPVSRKVLFKISINYKTNGLDLIEKNTANL